jgi:pimeloyl-ACP methyl ester carboxylesterase
VTDATPLTALTDEVLRPGDLDHVAGPLVGERIGLTDDGWTDVDLAGPDGGEVVLLIAGLGQHRTDWPPEVVAALHDAGYRTVRADNRDAGRATVLDIPLDQLPRGGDGWPVPPYDLARLATDQVEVLDHLGVDRAHVLGVSMGGMIAQHVALGHPGRVATLTSVMSTTGARSVGGPSAAAKPVLSTVAPTDDLDAYVEHVVWTQGLTGTPGHVEEYRAAARARVKWARGLAAVGTARQLLAIRSDGDRTGRLGAVTAPTLVLHGDADPLIHVSGGEATAAAIPGARLEVVPGWGHDLPRSYHDRLVPLVLDHLAAHG